MLSWLTKRHVLLGALFGVVLQLMLFVPSEILRIVDGVLFAGIAVDVWVHNFTHLKKEG